MAKKSKIERTKRCAKLIAQYRERRIELAAIIKNPQSTMDDRLAAYKKFSRMPRDASSTRLRNRCALTGRPRAFMRKFKLSRIAFRELALDAKLPGITKSSW
ncbi:MAG: 30S ribosomal protein S14 [Candidatus Hydrogenedentota bacterium]